MLDRAGREVPPGALPQSDKLLFKGQYLEVRRRDAPEQGIVNYEYMHEAKLKGKAVALLPYRDGIAVAPGEMAWDNGEVRQYLLRQEIVPAWSIEFSTCSITGMGDDAKEDVVWTAMRELAEESGYNVDENELIILGTVRLGKSCDTVVYLFSVNLMDAEEGEATGDGTPLEASARCDWADASAVLATPDPLVHVMYNRLQAALSDQSDMKIREEWFETPQQRQAIK